MKITTIIILSIVSFVGGQASTNVSLGYPNEYGLNITESRDGDQVSEKKLPAYLDVRKSLELRVQDALSRMTLEEKTRLSYADGRFSTPGCARLGIPGLMYSDGPHGVRAEICWNSWAARRWSRSVCRGGMRRSPPAARSSNICAKRRKTR